MRPASSAFFALFLFIAQPGVARQAGIRPVILPAPRVSLPRETVFRFSSATRVVLGEGCTTEDRFAAEQFLRSVRELKPVDLRIVEEGSLRKLGDGALFIGPPKGSLARRLMSKRGMKLTPAMKEEGYGLDVDRDGIVLLAESPAGRFYGLMSLVQLVRLEKKSLVVPGSAIQDWPLEVMRGITDDLSRNQVSTMENFKKIIRLLARYKLNIYSPYIEDIVMFKSHPLIGKNRGSITTTELRELDAYARQYHVQVIPIFETLGHWENILAKPQYVQFAEFPGAHTLNVSDERVYAMLDDMIGELASCFRSPYFNMAADESWDVGLGANKERVARNSLAGVHAEHYIRLFDILRKYKKKPMMYGDILLNEPDILTKIPKEVVIVDWHYGAAEFYGSPETFRAAGVPFVVSPAVWNFTGPFPNYLNTFVNIRNLNRDGYAAGSLGLLTSNWNDYGGEALRELNAYGYAWTAECAWNPTTADVNGFGEKFFRDYFGSEASVLPASSVFAILSDPVNQMNWHELWRHPFLPERSAPIPSVVRVQSIVTTMPVVRRHLEVLRSAATRNRDQIDHLAFVVRTNEWFANKLSNASALRKWGATPGGQTDSLRSAGVDLCAGVIESLAVMKQEFRRLWLANNRPDNLEWLMMRYDRQAAWWNEKREEVRLGKPWGAPLLSSPFIYHPLANPRKRDSAAAQVPRAYFRKVFTLTDTTGSALLQWIGDTHAKVWLNGILLGESFVRTSLSLMIEYERVQLVEIAPFLRKGENVLAIEVANYGAFGSAGCNVYAEIGGMRLMTDSTWRVGRSTGADWMRSGFSDAGWDPAKVVPYPNQITSPDFAARRRSWVER